MEAEEVFMQLENDSILPLSIAMAVQLLSAV